MVLLISQYWRTPCTKDLRGSSLFFAKKRRGLACRLGRAVPLATGKHRPQTPQEKNLYVCFKTSIFTDEKTQPSRPAQGLLTATPCSPCAAAADKVGDLRRICVGADVLIGPFHHNRRFKSMADGLACRLGRAVPSATGAHRPHRPGHDPAMLSILAQSSNGR